MSVVRSACGRDPALVAAILTGAFWGAANLAEEAKDQIRQQPSATALSHEAGTVEGVVRFSGEVPKSVVPDNAGVRRELLQVNRETHGLRDVVVWLVGKEPKDVRKSEEPLPPALMDQRDQDFVPRVLAVRSGQPVKFSNSDPANHNVRASAPQPTNEFNVFTGVDGSYTHRFLADPQQRPVRLGCDIHPWMRGWIYVFNHPWFAVTDERGRFRIGPVPAGNYKLVLQQPDIRYNHVRTIVVSNAEIAKVEVEVR